MKIIQRAKRRILILAGFREYRAKVYVDGELVNEFRGNYTSKELYHKYI